MKQSTKKAFVALALAVGAKSITVCAGGGPEDHYACPDCGGEGYWKQCEDCKGTGLVSCICEGAGGQIICVNDCFRKACQ